MQAPDVVVVGAATRDLSDDDPRGWLLGGGVTFGALALARLGLRTGVVVGVDDFTTGAREFDLICGAGAVIVEARLEHGPVFTNVETLSGRIQTCGSPSDPVPVDAVPEAWRRAPAWVFAPVADEIPATWAGVPRGDACVAFAWQGILRRLRAGERVLPKPPGPSPLLERADILAASRHDLPGDLALRQIGAWVGQRCDLLLTAGLLGGMLIRFEDGRIAGARAYASIPSIAEVDATGAGDTMLAGLVAARLVGGPDGKQGGRDLRLGAAASSLLVEGPGMDSVPGLRQLPGRLGLPR